MSESVIGIDFNDKVSKFSFRFIPLNQFYIDMMMKSNEDSNKISIKFFLVYH